MFSRSACARFFVDLVITTGSEFHVSFCAVLLSCFVHFVLMSLQSLVRHAVAVAPHCEFVNFIASSARIPIGADLATFERVQSDTPHFPREHVTLHVESINCCLTPVINAAVGEVILDPMNRDGMINAKGLLKTVRAAMKHGPSAVTLAALCLLARF